MPGRSPKRSRAPPAEPGSARETRLRPSHSPAFRPSFPSSANLHVAHATMRSGLLTGLLALARAPDAPDMTITHRVFFDVAIDGKPVGQVELGACASEL